MFIKVQTLPDGNNADNEVVAIILMGAGCMIVPVTGRGVTRDHCKLIFPDGRAVVVAHSITYMEALLMGEHQRAGLVSDVDKQLGATGKQ